MFCFRLCGVVLWGQEQTDKSRVWEEARCHEQRAAETTGGSEGACSSTEEPVTVRETAEETAAGSGGNEKKQSERHWNMLNHRYNTKYVMIYSAS